MDDENLTRTGLKSSIDWMDLGIDEVYLAADGEEGLHQANIHKPEIILSDVRMPRMTGIEMMDRVHETQPDTVFIFMSGYSDKDYLKAAIRLQAVSYVEKPLDPDEVSEAVREAVSRRTRLEQSRHARSVSETVSASHLALCLTMPYSSSRDTIQTLSREYCRKYGSPEMFRSAFTLLLQMDDREDLSPDFLASVSGLFHDQIRAFHMHLVSAEKRTSLFVFHLFRRDSFTEKTVQSAAEILARILPADRNWYLAAGSIVSGINRLYDSYSSAVILLQHSFFCAPHSILTSGTWKPGIASGDASAAAQKLRQALKKADREDIQSLEKQLYDILNSSGTMLRRTVQTMYYQIASTVFEERKRRQLPGAGILETAEISLDALDHCFSFMELHHLLTEITEKYLKDVENYIPENSSVYLIKKYIQENYGNPMLSTKEISQYASLSASYACTVFKNETGQTLNQYLTEYRLERAKELLGDPRNNISDVASSVGYNDSNYFGKAFKKFCGLSPSEYRENLSSR